MKHLPHDILLKWALDDDLVLKDWVINKETNEPVEIYRGLSIAERLAALKAAAPFFAPTLKSIEAKGTLDLETMDLDALKAKVMDIMTKAVKDERKAH